MGRLALAAVLLAGCATDGDSGEGDALPEGELQPLAVGMRWEYTGDRGERHLHRVTAREKVGRFDCFVLERASGAVVQKLWMRTDRDGVKHYRVQDGDLPPLDMDDPVVHAPLPARPGTRAEYESDTVVGRLAHRVEIEAVDTLRVPAGEFRCARVRNVGASDGVVLVERRAWYAPGVGLVQEVSKFQDGREGRIVLKEFTR